MNKDYFIKLGKNICLIKNMSDNFYEIVGKEYNKDILTNHLNDIDNNQKKLKRKYNFDSEINHNLDKKKMKTYHQISIINYIQPKKNIKQKKYNDIYRSLDNIIRNSIRTKVIINYADKTPFFNLLPLSILIHIFSFLSNYCKVKLVCNFWRNLASCMIHDDCSISSIKWLNMKYDEQKKILDKELDDYMNEPYIEETDDIDIIQYKIKKLTI